MGRVRTTVAFALLCGAGCLANNPGWDVEEDASTSASSTTSGTATASASTTNGATSTQGTSSTSAGDPTGDPTSDSTGDSASDSTGGDGLSTGAAGPDYEEVVLADTPVSYWRLGEGSGTEAADAMGEAPGTYLGDLELGHPGLVRGSDTSVYFPGGGQDFVRFGDVYGFPGRAEFSVEAWVQPDVIGAGCIIGKSTYLDTTHRAWFLASHQSMVRFQRDPGGFFSTEHPDEGQIFHVVATYDGFTAALYIDGTRLASTLHEVDMPEHTDPLIVGDCANWGNFAGFIDEVAIYNYALEEDQVSAHFNAGESSN